MFFGNAPILDTFWEGRAHIEGRSTEGAVIYMSARNTESNQLNGKSMAEFLSQRK
jgi:hypothetical protein